MRLILGLAALVVSVEAQQDLAPETLRLAKIKATVAENLSRLPNYTCTETIQRSTTGKIDGKPRLMMAETLRLEVAYLEGKELFGWPGTAKLDEPDIAKMIDGSIGNGYFGLLPRSIFAGPSASLRYIDAGELEGKPALRYDYRVPQKSGAYYIKTSLGQAVVEFHGSFWVNPATLDLIRITLAVDNPPAVLGVRSTSSVLDFSRQTIGSSAFLLPRSADLIVVDDDGTENQSRLSFAGCHQFIGESVLKFDSPASEPTAAPVKMTAKTITLPDDFTVDFNLDTPIDAPTTAGGDPVHATLRDALRLDGAIVLAKGAGLSGRVAHLAMRGDLYYLEFTLTSLDFEGGHADLSGRRNGVSVKNEPLIYRSPKFKLGRGARLTLHSRLLNSVHNDPIRP